MNVPELSINTQKISRKAMVAPGLSSSIYSESQSSSKPKGLRYSSSVSSITFSSRSDLISKPSSKKHFSEQATSNPITQSEKQTEPTTGKKILPSAPSAISIYSNQRKHVLPSEMGIGNRYSHHYSSQVFSESSTSYLFNGKTKNLLQKQGEISSLLTYNYALPYKEQPVTRKIGQEKRFK